MIADLRIASLIALCYYTGMNTLLALALLIQDQSAEDAFKKLEDAVENAHSVAMRFSLDGTVTRGNEKIKVTAKGTLLLKGSSLVSISRTVQLGDDQEPAEMAVKFTSDGTQMSFDFPELKHNANLDKKTLSVARFKSSLVRVGASTTVGFIGTYDPSKKEGGVLSKEAILVSDLKEGAKSNHGKTLTYTLRYVEPKTAGDPDKPFNVVLEYDPLSWKILSRVVTYKGEAGEQRIQETYQDFTLNSDIPDEKFKLPHDKK